MKVETGSYKSDLPIEEPEGQQFGIDEDGMAHICNILRDLYSDKLTAIIREYSVNAVDAHVEKGIKDVPIYVHLPTFEDPSLKIRDYGYGLSEDQVYNVFAKYGASTKNDSNSFCGSYGIGGKSLFAYTQQFSVISRQGGIQKTYTCFLDETDIGKVSKTFELDTDEPDGLEIIGPIATNDIFAVRDRVQSIYQYFNPRPETNIELKYEEYEPLISGTYWELCSRKFTYNSVAIMGNIGYPISDTQIFPKWTDNNTLDQAAYELLRNYSLKIHFDIGDLAITPSREALKYTNKTLFAIRSKVGQIIEELKDKIDAEIQKQNNLLDATKLANRLSNLDRVNTDFRKILTQLKYNEISINYEKAAISFLASSATQHEISIHACFPIRKARGFGFKFGLSQDLEYISCKDGTQFIFDDCNDKYVRRLREPLSQDSSRKKQFVVFQQKHNNEEAFKKFLKDNRLEGLSYEYLSDYEQIKLNSSVKKASPRNPKQLYKEFKFNQNGANSHKWSDAWEPTELDLDKSGVYCALHRYKSFNTKDVDLARSGQGYPVDTSYGLKPSDLCKVVDDLEQLGINIPTIYGLRPKFIQKHESRIDQNFTLFSDWAYQKIKDHVEQNDLEPYFLMYDVVNVPHGHLERFHKGLRTLNKNVNHFKLDEWLSILDNFEKKRQQAEAIKRICGSLGEFNWNEFSKKGENEGEQLFKEVKRDFPLFVTFMIESGIMGINNDKVLRDELIQYLDFKLDKVMEVC